MNITDLSMNMSNINVKSDFQVGLLSKELDKADVVGEQLTKMMEQSITPELGQHIDIKL